jgi:hypothetical protein
LVHTPKTAAAAESGVAPQGEDYPSNDPCYADDNPRHADPFGELLPKVPASLHLSSLLVPLDKIRQHFTTDDHAVRYPRYDRPRASADITQVPTNILGAGAIKRGSLGRGEGHRVKSVIGRSLEPVFARHTLPPGHTRPTFTAVAIATSHTARALFFRSRRVRPGSR